MLGASGLSAEDVDKVNGAPLELLILKGKLSAPELTFNTRKLVIVIIPSFGERDLATELFAPFRYAGSDDVDDLAPEPDHLQELDALAAQSSS